jgi:hypothetical protein
MVRQGTLAAKFPYLMPCCRNLPELKTRCKYFRQGSTRTG